MFQEAWRNPSSLSSFVGRDDPLRFTASSYGFIHGQHSPFRISDYYFSLAQLHPNLIKFITYGRPRPKYEIFSPTNLDFQSLLLEGNLRSHDTAPNRSCCPPRRALQYFRAVWCSNCSALCICSTRDSYCY